MKAWTWTRGEWELLMRERANGRYELRLWRKDQLIVSRDFRDGFAATECALDLVDLGNLIRQYKEAASA